jgi:hypothetical protein
MVRRLARIFTTLALVVGLGAGVSSGAASATPSGPQPQNHQISYVDWWW